MMTPDCFRRIVRDHGPRLRTYAAWLLGDVEEALDVSQDALLRLWTHRDRVVVPAARSWLLRTTHRLCIDRIRRRAVRPTFDRTPPDALVAPPDGARPDAARAAVGRALAALPVETRGLVLLREAHGLTYHELAAVLDQPVGTVKTNLHRARERMRAALAAEHLAGELIP